MWVLVQYKTVINRLVENPLAANAYVNSSHIYEAYTN